MNQTSKEPEALEQEQPSLGQTLAMARQKAGISFAEIETRLKLNHTQITKLEQDDYQSLVPETFVKGYIKNYCNLLGIDANEVLALYQKPQVPVQKRRMQSFSRRTEKEAHDNRLMLVSYIVLAIVLGSSAFWFWQTNNTEQPFSGETSEAVTAPETAVAPQASDKAATVEPLAEPNTTELDAAVDKVVSDTVAPAAAPAAEPQPNTTATAATGNTVVMHFKQESWVEMFDATQERVAFGVKKAGYTMTVTGKAPFSVVLGKHQAVEVELDGVAITLPEFEKNRLAKFNLPLTE